MAFNLRNKNLITVGDWSNDEVKHVLQLSWDLKKQRYTGQSLKDRTQGKRNIAVIMQKDSTRTRSAFEVAAFDLGMNVTYIGGNGSQMGKKESIEDTAKVLGRFYDGIAFRGSANEDVEMLANHAGVPVWNALTDKWHPTQMFADYLTVLENFGTTKVKFVYFGDARNNMGNSLAVMSAHMGAHFVGVAPKELWPEQDVIDKANEIAKLTGAKIEFTESPEEGAKDADVIYTDVWVSMGEPEEVWAHRIELLKDYQVNSKVMSYAKPTAIFLHCLPAFHDLNTKVGESIHEKFGLDSMEVSDEVFRSHASKVFDQAENRMHTIKAIMLSTLGF